MAKSEQPTFNHNGTTITIGAGGQFEATVQRTKIRKPSLEAAKKAIDKLSTFQRFKALRVQYSNIHECEVIGQRVDGRSYSRRVVWVLADGGAVEEVYAVDQRAALEAVNRMSESVDQQIQKLRDSVRERRLSIPKLKPEGGAR